MSTEGNIVLLCVSVCVLAVVGLSFMLHLRKLVRMLLVGAGVASAVTAGVGVVRLLSGPPKTSALGGSGGSVQNNQAAPPEAPVRVTEAGIRNLTREQTERYIANQRGFRYDQDLTMANPREQVRLNLGEAFRRYMINSGFRSEVDRLVLDPLSQIWSDVVRLELTATQVRDIKPLAGLTNLRSLYFSDTQVEDISSLAGLTNLNILDLSGTQVRDISPLAGLTNLRNLYLYNTQVENIMPLAGLTLLQELHLTLTRVHDIMPLAGLTRLQDLTLSRTQVQDITPLARLTNLRVLYLSGTQVEDISALAGLTGLRALYLSGTRVNDITPLNGLIRLQELDLSRTRVRSITPLAGLQYLRNLDVTNAPLVDLTTILTFVSRYALQVDRDPTPPPRPIANPNVPAQPNWPVNNTPPHAQIVTEIPTDENDRECKMCCETVVTKETLHEFVNLGNHGINLCCRACVIGMQTAAHNRGREVNCPYCREPLGPLPF